MPTPLPVKLRVRGAVRTRASERHSKANDDRRALGVWAISLGFAALAVATMAYATAGDRIGAASILTAAAVVIALLTRGGEGGPRRSR